MTPRELLETIAQIPVSPATRRALLHAATAGRHWATWLVQAHRWRQQVTIPRPFDTLLERVWRWIWRG